MERAFEIPKKPYTKTDGSIPVGSLPDGTELSIPVIVLRGEKDRPVVYVQAGLHGNEITGVAILLRALQEIELRSLTGTIVAVPLANVGAAITRTRGFALEERGPIDLNRIFPGNADGLLSERIASLVFEGFVRHADVAIDLHSALAGCDIHPFVYIDPDDNQKGTLEVRERLARAAGTPLVYRSARGRKLGTSVMTGSLATQADKAGKALVAIEMGRSDFVSQEHLGRGARGLLNVFRAAGVLSGEVEELAPDRIEFDSFTIVHAQAAGLFLPTVDLGDRVAGGALLGTMTNPRNGRIEQIEAPHEGLVLRLMNPVLVMPGAELVWLANAK